MAAANFNKIFGVKRTIWNSESFYVQDDDVKEQYKRDVMEQYEIDDEDELTEEKLAQYWYEDNEFSYDCERGNLGKDIDGCIIALARRSSHYGAICGNGREATKVVGYNIAGILETTADDAGWWAEDYNIEGRLNDHDGRLVNAQCELKYEKKLSHTVVIFSVLNDHSGRFVRLQ